MSETNLKEKERAEQLEKTLVKQFEELKSQVEFLRG